MDVRKPNVRFDELNEKAFGYRTFGFWTFGSLTLNRTFGSTRLYRFIYIKNFFIYKTDWISEKFEPNAVRLTNRTFKIRTKTFGFRKPNMFGNRTKMKSAEILTFGFRTSTVHVLKIHPKGMATLKNVEREKQKNKERERERERNS